MSRFQTTRWGLIASATTQAQSRAGPALEELCRACCPPVPAYIRYSGHRDADAEDLTQAFYLRLLEGGRWGHADPARGRFRPLLLASLRHFLAEPDGPEQAFTRVWLAVLLDRAVEHLHQERCPAGRHAEFQRMGPLLLVAPDPAQPRMLALQWGVRAHTLAVQVHRMRGRLQQFARPELLQTVDSREALDAEIELRVAIKALP